MLKYLIQCQELMKQDTEWHQTGVSVNVDSMQACVIINDKMMIKAGVNAKN